MDKILSLGIVITAKNLAGAAFGKASGQIAEIGKSAEITRGKIAGISTASYAFGKSAASAIAGTYKNYADVAQAQGEIASLGIGESGIAAITKDAQAFSNQWAGTTKSDFIRASYDIKSGIASLSDVAVGKFTSMASLTATATKSTTGEMTKLFALGHGIYRKQFGSDIEFGEQFSAAISQSVKAFRTDGSDLSQGLSNLGAVATSFGVGLSEQLAIIGTAKGAFNSASEAATSYRAFLNGAGKAQKELGLSFVDSQGKMLSMPVILQRIKDKYGDISKVGTMDKIKKAFGSDEAVKMLTAMIDKGGDLEQSIKDIDSAMQNGTKTTEEMAKAMQKGKGFELLDQQIGNLSSTIGEAFAPAVEDIAGFITNLTGWISGLSQENKTMLGYVAIGIAAFAGLATVLGGLGIIFSGIMTIAPALGAAWTIAFGPVGFIIGTIAALSYAIYELYNNWQQIKEFWTDWDKVSSFFGFGGDAPKPAASTHATGRKPVVTGQKMASNTQKAATNNTVAVTINNPNFTSKEHAAQTQKQIDEQVRKAMQKQANDKKDRSYS